MDNIRDFQYKFYDGGFHLTWTNPSAANHVKIYINRYGFIQFGPAGAINVGLATSYNYKLPVLDSCYFSIYACNASETEVSPGYFAKILPSSILMGNVQDCTIGPNGYLYTIAGNKLIVIKLSFDYGKIVDEKLYVPEKYRKVKIF